MKPVLKWAGGKGQLLGEIRARVPQRYNTYLEPFLGGAAVLLALAPQHAVAGDSNTELMNLYRVIRDEPDRLIQSLGRHRNEEAYYYEVRAWDRSPGYRRFGAVRRASRIVFLNRTCYNGLYRVNSEGYFNVPFGRYKNPCICDEANLREVHAYLAENEVELIDGDFEAILQRAVPGDFVYLDPPYDPVSETASFTSYQGGGFGRAEQQRLKRCCDALDARGVRFLLSNSDTEFIRDLYRSYHIETVLARRAINCQGAGRAQIREVLVRNYAE